jgi:hypothetical protein
VGAFFKGNIMDTGDYTFSIPEKIAQLDMPETDKLVDLILESPPYKELKLPKILKEDLARKELVMYAFTPTGPDKDPARYNFEDENDEIQSNTKKSVDYEEEIRNLFDE